MVPFPTTPYERIYYLYSRDASGFLSFRPQKSAPAGAQKAWSYLASAEIDKTWDESVFQMSKGNHSKMVFFEKSKGDTVVGLATECFEPTKFELWFMATVLDNSALLFEADFMSVQKAVALRFTEIFEQTIKNSARVDRWDEGRDAFIRHVDFFTSRGLPVEAVLPAFPCKSHNRDKAKEGRPDRGEELAIRRIIDFVSQIQELYPPGMRFYIVSDGHVFSDCINVDDDVVDQYTEDLKSLYESIKPEGFQGIYFKGLNDCFASPMKNVIKSELESYNIEHFLGTVLDKETELNRKILMLGCDDNDKLLREQIKTPGHPRLYLYRGFNKFMFEDLINTPAAQALSNKKFKKLVSFIAYEMIRRNDAYSNLVELIFPFHLRLSIHAHHNAGPKYGIRLLDPKLCSTGLHDQDEEDRLLHIPTPWHNAVFEVSDQPKLIVSPVNFRKEYEEDESYTGGWSDEKRCFVYTRR